MKIKHKRETKIKHQFVEYIPEHPHSGILYVSVEYATCTHLCCCGCGEKVVTPLSPTDWNLIFDGETVSLFPSVGNWSFACRSHYWIRSGRVEWSYSMDTNEVATAKQRDEAMKRRYYEKLLRHKK